MINLKPLVNDYALYHSFLEYVNKRLEVARDKAEQSRDINEIMRAQGAAHELRQFLKLREEVNGREN
jgi:hypothetical protein